MDLYGPDQGVPRNARAVVAVLVVIVAVVVLGAVFFRNQVLQDHDYVLQAEDNRIAAIPIPAPRGRILDRYGRVIADTRPGYALLLEPTTVDSIRVALALLQPTLDLDGDAVARLTAAFRAAPDRPLVVSAALTDDQAAAVEERREGLPRLRLERRLVREYPGGDAVAHLVGYVGEIDPRELADTASFAGYQAGQQIGRAGLEMQYETLLAGVRGERYAEVDGRGNLVGSVAPRQTMDAVAGRDLRITLDLELQQFIDSIFPSRLNGAVVAIEPETGDVLALYSHPTFDPGRLIAQPDSIAWSDLRGDPRQPMVNRAISGIYPPGASWKLATAVIGLERGVIQPESRMPIPCSGGISYAGRYARCWNSEGHGALDLTDALAASCDVYFYQLGIWLGLNQLAREGTRLGFARRTGIDLPTEGVGIFPEGEAWYERELGAEPSPDDVMTLAVGQGPNLQSPVRMAQLVAAVAGSGRAPAPHLLAREERGDPETVLQLEPRLLNTLQTGLREVLEPGGRAYEVAPSDWKMSGTTGTADNPADPDRPHAWFTGFAGPHDMEPEIAIAVVVEAGRSGPDTAAPIAAQAVDFYLRRKYAPGDSPERGRSIASIARRTD